MSSKDSQPKNKDIRSLAADLVYKASWPGTISPEEAIIKIIKIAEQAALKALADLDKDFVQRLPFPCNKRLANALKRNLILDMYAWAHRTTKAKIKEEYHILTQEKVEHENLLA